MSRVTRRMWADNSYVKDYIEMQNDTEADEKTHLEQIKRKLNEALERLDGRVRRYAADIKEQKTYLS